MQLLQNQKFQFFIAKVFNTAVKIVNASLTCGEAALSVGCPGWGIPAQPRRRKIAFAFSHLYASKSTQPPARKVINVADETQASYKGACSGPRTLVITPTLSLVGLGRSRECWCRTDREPP